MNTASTIGMLGVAAAVTAASAPAAGRTASGLAAPQEWLARDGVDAVSATLAQSVLALLAGWVTLGLLAALAATLPGAGGALARRIARHTLPAALYRLAVGATGLGVVLAPVAAGAATPTAAPPLPAPTLPGTSAGIPAAPLPATGTATAVTVVAGDSLWHIAATHLPGRPSDAAIAAAWPRWYAVNRAVVGADPDLVFPGQVLHNPKATP